MTARVLVVDDEDSMRELLSITLNRQGYETLVAADGVKALKMMEKDPAEVMVTDLFMPRMGGMELLEKVKEGWPDTVVFIITAFGTIENAVQAMQLGAYDYVSKPFNMEELTRKVREMLDGKA